MKYILIKNKYLMCFRRCMDRVFDDKRIAVMFLIVWLIIVIVVFKDIGLLDTKFMSWGPSDKTVFMGMVLDSWYKWGMVAIFTFVNTSINDFMSDAISPWLLNTITDHKTKFLPYSKGTCLVISQMWSVYCNVMSVFGLFLAMTQVDFVMIRMAADLMVNCYTNLRFMRNKITCEERYKRDMETELNVVNLDTIPMVPESDKQMFSIDEETPDEANQKV